MAVNRYNDARAWYAISTYSGYEDKVADSIRQRINTIDLADKIFDAIVPKEKQIEIKNGKRKVVDKKIFQGYVLVEMKLSGILFVIPQALPALLVLALNHHQFPKKKLPRSKNAWAQKIQNTPSTTKLARLFLSPTAHSKASTALFPKLIQPRANSKSWFPCLVAKPQLSLTLFRLNSCNNQ